MQAGMMGMPLSPENIDLIWGYPSRVPLRNIRDIVWDRLLALGICPGGTRADALAFDDDNHRKALVGMLRLVGCTPSTAKSR